MNLKNISILAFCFGLFLLASCSKPISKIYYGSWRSLDRACICNINFYSNGNAQFTTWGTGKECTSNFTAKAKASKRKIKIGKKYKLKISTLPIKKDTLTKDGKTIYKYDMKMVIKNKKSFFKSEKITLYHKKNS